MNSAITKKRHPWLAALLGMCLGLGFMYAGNFGMALATPLIALAAIAIFSWTGLVFSIWGLATLITLLIAIYLGSMIGAAILARRNSPMVLKRYQRWYWYLCFWLLTGVGQAAYSEFRGDVFGIEPFRIPAESMANTLIPGDFMMVDRWAYKDEPPKRGDIIVFNYPRNPSLKYVKRVVGLPGETISSKGRQIFIDGKPLDESEWDLYYEQNGRARDMVELNIPPGSYLVLGDNRYRSNDSRFWGYLPKDHILGKAKLIWASVGEQEGLRTERIGLALDPGAVE